MDDQRTLEQKVADLTARVDALEREADAPEAASEAESAPEPPKGKKRRHDAPE